MNITMKFIFFAMGAIIGSVAVWQHTRKKYEQIIQNEIDSVKEVFSKKTVDTSDEDINTDIRAKANQAKEKPDVIAYTTRLHNHEYTHYGNIDMAGKERENTVINEPYVIPPEEFGELDEYGRIDLFYHADGILADTDGELIEDVESIVGFESLRHFGEYEDDSVYVRNDRLKCDYEILLDQREYSDILKEKPHQMEE